MRWFAKADCYVELTTAQNMFPDLFGSGQAFGVRVGDVALEVCVTNHLGQIRTGFWMAQETLREEDDELWKD